MAAFRSLLDHCISKGAKIADPTRKMSKSDDNDRATLYILDEPDRILKKIGSAVTDSGSEVEAGPAKAGVSNLLAIHAVGNIDAGHVCRAMNWITVEIKVHRL